MAVVTPPSSPMVRSRDDELRIQQGLQTQRDLIDNAVKPQPGKPTGLMVIAPSDTAVPPKDNKTKVPSDNIVKVTPAKLDPGQVKAPPSDDICVIDPEFCKKVIEAIEKALADAKAAAERAIEEQKERIAKERKAAQDAKDRIEREKQARKDAERERMNKEKERLDKEQKQSDQERKNLDAERDKQKNFEKWAEEQDRDLRGREQNFRNGADPYCETPPCQKIQELRGDLNTMRLGNIKAGLALEKADRAWLNNARDLSKQQQAYNDALWNGVGLDNKTRLNDKGEPDTKGRTELERYRQAVKDFQRSAEMQNVHDDLKARQTAFEKGSGPPLSRDERSQLDKFNKAADRAQQASEFRDLQARQGAFEQGKGPPLSIGEKYRLDFMKEHSTDGALQDRAKAAIEAVTDKTGRIGELQKQLDSTPSGPDATRLGRQIDGLQRELDNLRETGTAPRRTLIGSRSSKDKFDAGGT